MSKGDNFLHTTHRTVTWFNKVFGADELTLSPPYQRNQVWTNVQKSYLIDTILNALPIPELYMQDRGNEDGDEEHIVVDGQQRIRAVLDYVRGNYALSGDDVTRQWRGLRFDDLSVDDRRTIFGYKFVVRILPSDLGEDEIRRVFSRLNKNVAALTDQELRNATYWGPFISTIQSLSDTDPYWAECGIFSANDHRRMVDQEFISELVIAYLHGPQNKKDRLNQYYLTYEEGFENRDLTVETFGKVTTELRRTLPRLTGTRWRKKSDFYTLFLAYAARVDRIPFDGRDLERLASKIIEFGEAVDRAFRVDPEDTAIDRNVMLYAGSVARAASDRANRVARARAFSRFVFEEEPTVLEVGETFTETEQETIGLVDSDEVEDFDPL